MNRILVVDDEESIAFALTRYFGSRGFEVVSTHDLEEAQAMLLNDDYAAVIADLRLTGVHGAEGLELISFARRHAPRTRTILLTAFGSRALQEEAVRRGADLVLEKPQPLPELAALLSELLAGVRP